MMDICLLGTGGTMPLPGRALTALIVRYQGKSILIDCGEGTQISVQEAGLSMNPIDAILFTHCHADHIAGLPGFLLTMGKQGRTEPVRLIGPLGLAACVNGLRVIAPELPYEVELTELAEPEQSFPLDGLRVEAFAVDHDIPCYGYSLNVDRAGKFDPERAKKAGIPKQYWGRLQKGETIETEAGLYTPDMVLGAPRKGIKVTYCTDTRPTERIERYTAGSDLFICEGMYGEEEKLDKAVKYKHMLFREAAMLASRASVRELWLTHYSPSIADPQSYLEAAQSVFPNTVIPEDRQSLEMRFE